MRSDSPLQAFMQQSLINASNYDQQLIKVSIEGLPIKYDDLSEVASSIPNAKPMSEILKF